MTDWRHKYKLYLSVGRLIRSGGRQPATAKFLQLQALSIASILTLNICPCGDAVAHPTVLATATAGQPTCQNPAKTTIITSQNHSPNARATITKEVHRPRPTEGPLEPYAFSSPAPVGLQVDFPLTSCKHNTDKTNKQRPQKANYCGVKSQRESANHVGDTLLPNRGISLH